MLELDYDLIPLSQEDQDLVRHDARTLAGRGGIPPLSPHQFGRLVVVNPNIGHPMHPLPDDLRKPLRRMAVPVYESGKPLQGGEIIRKINERANETLYVLLLEIHSTFPSLQDFLPRLPHLAGQHPQSRFIIHSNLEQLTGLIREAVGRQKATLAFYFNHQADPVVVASEEGLANLVTVIPRYPGFPISPFTRMKIRQGEKTEWFTQEGMKRLVNRFGVGNLNEMDIPARQKEKLLSLEIPLSAVAAVALNPKPGGTFAGVVMDGKKIPISMFAQLGLDKKEIPLNRIQAIIRHRPIHQDEEIPLAQVRALKIRCLDGSTALAWKAGPAYIPLLELASLRISWPQKSPGSTPLAGKTAENTEIFFESVIVTEENHPRMADVRGAIRLAYLQTIYQESLSRTIRLQRITGQLKIACLGPLAAQTLKVLNPMGLSRYIPPGSIYFLTDSISQLAEYEKFPQRLESLYGQLLKELTDLFSSQAGGTLNLGLINHKMVLIQTWVNTPPSFADLKPDGLEGVYNEMRSFMDYMENEFKRIDPQGTDAASHLENLHRVEKARLLTKQISNLLSRQYGKFFSAEEYPDFVFFGTDSEFQQNGREVFLPGIGWNQVFKNPAVAGLFAEGDFAFSLFLEEQVSVMETLRRQEMTLNPTESSSLDYFKQRIAQAEKELEDLRQTAQPEEMMNSESYRATHKMLEDSHYSEITRYENEWRQEMKNLRQAEETYFHLLGGIHDQLKGVELPHSALLSGEDYILALDKVLETQAQNQLTALGEHIQKISQQVNQELEARRNLLKGYLAAFVHIQKTLFPLRREEFFVKTRNEIETSIPGLLEKLNRLASAGGQELQRLEKRIHVARVDMKRELEQINSNLERMLAKNQQAFTRLRDGLARIMGLFQLPSAQTDPGHDPEAGPSQILEKIKSRQEEAYRELKTIVVSAKESNDGLFSALKLLYVKKQETSLALFASANELALVGELKNQSGIKRWVGQKITHPLVPPPDLKPQADIVQLEKSMAVYLAQWEKLETELTQNPKLVEVPPPLYEALAEFNRFEQLLTGYNQAVRQRTLHQTAAEAIQNRLSQLKEENPRLAELIYQRMLPAYRILCEKFFIPLAQRRIGYLKSASLFMQEVGRLSYEELQREFLNRALFRRFHLGQFVSGAYYGLDTGHPAFGQVRNTLPAIFQFSRVAVYNLEGRVLTSTPAGLTKLPPAPRPAAIVQFCEEQAKAPAPSRHTYLVLPATLTLPQALDVILRKEQIFHGLPRLVLIYVSKFNPDQIKEDSALRENYFKAARHNVILNIRGSGMVDSPEAIAHRLIQETLGSAFNLPQVRYPEDYRSPVAAEAPPDPGQAETIP